MRVAPQDKYWRGCEGGGARFSIRPPPADCDFRPGARQEGPKTREKISRRSQEGSKTAPGPPQTRQDDPRSCRSDSRCPQDAIDALRDGQGRLQRVPRTLSRGPATLKIIGFTAVKRTFSFLHLSLHFSLPRSPGGPPRVSQEPREGAQGVQDGARTAPRGAQDGAKKKKTSQEGYLGRQGLPKGAPRGAQGRSGSRPRPGWTRGPLRRPRFGPFFDHFWYHFSTIVGQCWIIF